MYEFEYRIVEGKNLFKVGKHVFDAHMKKYAPNGCWYKQVGDITYYYDEYHGKIIAERIIIYRKE